MRKAIERIDDAGRLVGQSKEVATQGRVRPLDRDDERMTPRLLGPKHRDVEDGRSSPKDQTDIGSQARSPSRQSRAQELSCMAPQTMRRQRVARRIPCHRRFGHVLHPDPQAVVAQVVDGVDPRTAQAVGEVAQQARRVDVGFDPPRELRESCLAHHLRDHLDLIGQWRYGWRVLTNTLKLTPSVVVATTLSSASVEGVVTEYSAGVTVDVATSVDGATFMRTRLTSPTASASVTSVSSG